MQTYPAERTEVLRTERKDEEFVEELTQRCSAVVKDLAGDRNWIRCHKWIRPVAKLAYYVQTSVGGVQTLGEEYMSLVPVSSSSTEPNVAHPIRRILYSALEGFGPTLLDDKLNAWRSADEGYYQQQLSNRPVPVGRIILSVLLKSLNFATLQRLHWAVFYLLGDGFYNLWKRVAGIKFMSLRPETNVRMDIVFKVIGFTAMANYFFSLVMKVKKEIRRKRRRISDMSPDSNVFAKDESFFCDICLNAGDPIATPCGHVYCFDCILFHSEMADLPAHQGQCPQCRSQFLIRKLIPIINL